MKNAGKIFVSDIKRLVRNPLAMIITIGLCFLPSLYAWFNIYSNWDPYANTANIRVAVVTEDKGLAMEDGTVSNMGDEVIGELRDNEKIGWEILTSSEEALEGVRSGKYYAAVVIEENFTEKIYHVFEEGFENPGITYYENEKKNAVATKITDTAVSTLKQSINSKFLETVASRLFEGAGRVSENLQEQQGMERFISQAEEMNQQLLKYDKVIDGILKGNKALTQAVDDAGDQMEELQEKTASGTEKIQAAQKDAADTRTSLSTFGANVDEVLGSVEESLNAASESIKKAQLSQKTQTVVNSVVETGKDVDTLEKGLDALKETLTAMRKKELGIDKLEDKIDAALEDISSLYKGVKDVKSTIEALKLLNDRKLDQVTSETAQLLTKDHTKQVTDALEACATSVNSMKSLYENSLAPEVGNILDSTERILKNAEDILGSLYDTLGNTSGIFEGVETTVEGTNKSLEQVQGILHMVSGRLAELAERLKNTDESERFEVLLQMLDGDSESYGEFFSGPVQMETKAIYPIRNYGSAMTPFYSILSLWVGALLLTALIKVKAEPENMPDAKLHHLFFGRYLLFFVLGQLQTAIVVWGDIYLLKCQILNKGVFWLTAAIASFVFTLLIYALTLSFGDIGKAAAVVMMVIQIAGSGGTFPIELLPSVYRNIYLFFPFPYAINAMRETIGGMYGDTYVISICKLLVFALAALLIGLVIRRPFLKINHFVEKRMEDTRMM